MPFPHNSTLESPSISFVLRHSTFQMSAVSSALSRTPNASLRELEVLLADPFLRTLFQGAIGSFVLDYKPSQLDVVTHLRYGVTTYSLDPLIADALYLALKKIGQIIHCAGNDFNPFTTLQPLPLSIPPSRLTEANLSTPLISLVLAFPGANPLLAECNSVNEVFHHVTVVRHIANYYVRWMARGIQTSIEQGVNAKWNWGIYWGMSWEDFMAQLGMPVTTSFLGELPSGVLEYDDLLVNNSLALILHPTISRAALIMKDRAAAILAGDIPTSDPKDILDTFATLTVVDDDA